MSVNVIDIGYCICIISMVSVDRSFSVLLSVCVRRQQDSDNNYIHTIIIINIIIIKLKLKECCN